VKEPTLASLRSSGQIEQDEVYIRPDVEIYLEEGGTLAFRWLEELAAQEKPKVEAYCKSIVDARMYLVFRLRFIRCYSWAEVAGVLGKGYTEDGVSRMAYNYLNKN